MDLHYCEIPVKEKHWYGTRTRMQGFLFSNLSWYLLYEEYGWDLDQIPKVAPAELMSKMVYLSAKVANFDKGLPALFTLQDVSGWIEKSEAKYYKNMETVYRRAMTVIAEEWKERGEGLKKK